MDLSDKGGCVVAQIVETMRAKTKRDMKCIQTPKQEPGKPRKRPRVTEERPRFTPEQVAAEFDDIFQELSILQILLRQLCPLMAAEQ